METNIEVLHGRHNCYC